MKEPIQAVQVLDMIPAAVVTADGNGTGVDLKEYEGDVAFVMDAGAGSGDMTLDCKIQDSADNSSFADVTGGAFTQVTTSASVQKIVLKSDEIRRYVRAVKDVGGTSPSFALSIKGLGFKKYKS